MRSAHLGRGSLANLDPHNGLNLYVYCNNHPVNVVDPSGLEGERPQPYSPLFDPRNAIDQMPFPDWKEFPHAQVDESLVESLSPAPNQGTKIFLQWLANDPERARLFAAKVYSNIHWEIKTAAHRYELPEHLLFAVVLSEVINFRWNDYIGLGQSTGLDQLTPASIKHYGADIEVETIERNQLWWQDFERVGYHRMVRSTLKGSDYQQAVGPEVTQEWTETVLASRAPRVNEVTRIDVYHVAAILNRQMEELSLAARGGGVLTINGNRIAVPAMSPGFLKSVGGISNPYALSITERERNPSNVMNFFGNGMAPLAGVLVSMNRENPQATGNLRGNAAYELGSGLKGEQAEMAKLLYDFRDLGLLWSSADGTILWAD